MKRGSLIQVGVILVVIDFRSCISFVPHEFRVCILLPSNCPLYGLVFFLS